VTLEVTWSDPCDALASSLVAALAEMPSITKDNTADIPTKTGGKYSYKYADLGSYLEQVRPVLARHGLAVLQPATTDNGTPSVTTIILHTSGQQVSSTLALRPTNNDAQSVGSAITYARRYALAATLSIATDDDDGAQASRPAPPPRPERLSEQRIEAFRAACHNEGVDEEGMYEIVSAATNGRTKNPGMVHEDEHRALQAAFKKWLADHPPQPPEGTEP
jgi:hypothetical protein